MSAPDPQSSPSARILITSVGSLVGRCLLDVLAGRRGALHLVGGDADPSCPDVAECDDAVVLPPSDHPDFVTAVDAVCRSHRIDLVLAGRDPDVLALSAANDDPARAVRGPFAPAALTAAAFDKWETARLGDRLGVTVTPTACTDDPHVRDRVTEIVRVWGFPLVTKPRCGSGSLGVRVVLGTAQLELALQRPGQVVQPYLDPPAAAAFDLDTSEGVPLFWEVPAVEMPTVMAVVEPDGSVQHPFCTVSTHRLGRVEEVRRADDPSLTAFAVATVGTFAAAGWRGPLNLECRPGPDGWHLLEINPRFSGGTSARLHLGHDEVGRTLNAWLGRPVVPAPQSPSVTRVRRLLHDVPVRP